MKIYLILGILLAFISCSKNEDKNKKSEIPDEFISGELAAVAKDRNLEPDNLESAARTFNPSGKYDEYIAFLGTGVSGRVAVVGMPSMRILKYVAVFSAEPWQGFAFDDQSKAVIKASARDEIEYSFGDSGVPGLSLTKGKHDARALFIADAANARLALVDLAEYETKQIVTSPLFNTSNPDVTVTENTNFVVQTSSVQEKIGLGVTFWRFLEKESDDHKMYLIDPSTSYSILLNSNRQSSAATGKNSTAHFAFTITSGDQTELNVINWKKADELLATKATKLKNHLTFDAKIASANDILKSFPIGKGANKIIISGDGKEAVITNKELKTIQLLDLEKIIAGKFEARDIDLGAISVDASFVGESIYVTTHSPSQLIRIDSKNMLLKDSIIFDYPVGNVFIPEGDTNAAREKYAVVTNHNPSGLYTSTGPQWSLSATLVNISDEKMKTIYHASIPQSTRLGGAAISASINKPIHKYKIGFDPRAGKISPFKTNSGKETIVRDGKRVHVYATLIRSHITPDTIEVEEGDIVSIHLTSNEQSKDNVHGFTIDTYNVHGSFEPGKTASLTFVADRPGVFPFYCTEFCSALHLEMQGYLLVRPLSNKQVAQADRLLKLHNNESMNDFFNFIKGE